MKPEWNGNNSKSRDLFIQIVFIVAIGMIMTCGLYILEFNDSIKTTEQIESRLPATEELIDSFVTEADLSMIDKDMLLESVASDLTKVWYNPNMPDMIYLDGAGYRNQKNLSSEFSFWIAYERLDASWHAYDWSFVETPTPALEMADWVCQVGDLRKTTIEVRYEHGSRYGEAPMFQIVDSYDGIVLDLQDWCDYNASVKTETGFDFIFNLDNGSRHVLHIGFDDRVFWDDRPLERKT